MTQLRHVSFPIISGVHLKKTDIDNKMECNLGEFRMKIVSTFTLSLLVFGFLFMTLPDKAYTQPVPFEGCCQFIGSCQNLSQEACIADATSIQFHIDESCNTDTGNCPGFSLGDTRVSNVPTLSEWGLIAMAGVLGVVGFMVMRRKRVTA